MAQCEEGRIDCVLASPRTLSQRSAEPTVTGAGQIAIGAAPGVSPNPGSAIIDGKLTLVDVLKAPLSARLLIESVAAVGVAAAWGAVHHWVLVHGVLAHGDGDGRRLWNGEARSGRSEDRQNDWPLPVGPFGADHFCCVVALGYRCVSRRPGVVPTVGVAGTVHEISLFAGAVRDHCHLCVIG